MCRPGWVRRGEEEEVASQAEAGIYAKAAWWHLALLVGWGKRKTGVQTWVSIFLLTALGSCWRVSIMLHIMKSLAAV